MHGRNLPKEPLALQEEMERKQELAEKIREGEVPGEGQGKAPSHTTNQQPQQDLEPKGAHSPPPPRRAVVQQVAEVWGGNVNIMVKLFPKCAPPTWCLPAE